HAPEGGLGVGGVGALVGLGAAYLLAQRAEREGETVQIGAGDAVKLGLLVLGLLRSVAQLGE
ncbi:MAG: hypothetical protein ACWGO1_06660, partial [Anaerolineales bacterium]